MPRILYYHPLSSYCHKVLLALYENETAFQGRIVDISDPESSADLFAAWPMGQIPLLRDDSRGSIIPETSVIIEYLDRNYPGPLALVPENAELRLPARQ